MKKRACSEPCWLKIDSTTYSSDLNQRRVSSAAGWEGRPKSSGCTIGAAGAAVSGFFDFTLSVTPSIIVERSDKCQGLCGKDCGLRIADCGLLIAHCST